VEVFGHGSIAGIDLDRFKPDPVARHMKRAETGDGERDFVFLFVGRISRDKGIYDLLKAFEHIRGLRPHAKLWIVGPDEEEIIASLKDLPHGATYWGSTECPEEFMKAADVLLLPSYREGFGVVIIEAAACGVPAIAYDIVGVRDAVVPRPTGLLVDLKNIDKLAEAMGYLEADKDVLHLMRINGIERATEYFDSKKITNNWISFYERMFFIETLGE
jgi:glycosyltransferase involved in cell wall biosynthesis